MDFQSILRFAVAHEASDVHLQSDLAPRIRMGGILRTTDQPPISDEQLRQFIVSIVPKRLADNIDERLVSGLDFSYTMSGVSRFRCSAYRQLGEAGISMRIIRGKIPTIAELNLPPIIEKIALEPRGLTLLTGTTGSGKSTTLAAMVELINQTRTAKIICIEDPVEYLYTPKMALISQLEVGSDTPSFDKALRQALRQDPDVILVGELRDMDTLRIALRAADTGHQVFSTVHSASAPQTVERIIAMFPPAEHKLLLTQLAGNLQSIISQRLMICRDGTRRPATEILRGGPVPQKFILEGRAMELGDYIRSAGDGQHTFDQDILSSFRQGLINHAEAMRNATNPDQLGMALRGISSSSSLHEATPTHAGHAPGHVAGGQPKISPPQKAPMAQADDLEEVS